MPAIQPVTYCRASARCLYYYYYYYASEVYIRKPLSVHAKAVRPCFLGMTAYLGTRRDVWTPKMRTGGAGGKQPGGQPGDQYAYAKRDPIR